MSTDLYNIDTSTKRVFENLAQQIRTAKQSVFEFANRTLVDLYWQIGKEISRKVNEAEWGKGVVSQLAEFIAREIPDAKGFSDKNLWRMKQFYELYSSDEKLSPLVRDLALPDIKDTYVLEFLGLPESHSEPELQKALVANMKHFILELGNDFIFMAEEFRLQVGCQDFYVDLLFFHRGIGAMVAFELKVGKFKPEYLGQLDFYLEALDRDVKKPHENPSIGILLCHDKDDEVVEYALSRSLSPTMVAQYQLQLPDKKIFAKKLQEL